MEHTPIRRSAHVQSVAHDGETLEVRYRDGSIYRWAGVSAKEHLALLGAPSVGAFLHGHIRKWHGEGVKLEDDVQTRL